MVPLYLPPPGLLGSPSRAPGGSYPRCRGGVDHPCAETEEQRGMHRARLCTAWRVHCFMCLCPSWLGRQAQEVFSSGRGLPSQYRRPTDQIERGGGPPVLLDVREQGAVPLRGTFSKLTFLPYCHSAAIFTQFFYRPPDAGPPPAVFKKRSDLPKQSGCRRLSSIAEASVSRAMYAIRSQGLALP